MNTDSMECRWHTFRMIELAMDAKHAAELQEENLSVHT